MANDVKWIRMMVGMFDGMSFKKIKRAKIGGESFRDKLTAVWFELMDFAGKCNHDGAFVSPSEIPFTELSDIATMIDREEEELELCMAFFLKEGMVTVTDDIYSLSNWAEYQNKEGLDKIREQTRKRVAKYREKQNLLNGTVTGNVTSNVTVTQGNGTEIEEDIELDSDIDNKEIHKETVPCQAVVDLYHSICISFPSVRSLSEARKKTIKARLKTYTLDDFKEVFTKAEASDFLKGSNNRNWSANFDWLIKDANMAKVLDGNYDNKGGSGRKEVVPTWMVGNAEKDAIRKLQAMRKNITNDPDLAARAEALKEQLSGGGMK